MSPKSKAAKKSSHPSKASKPAKRPPRAAAEEREPEVLNQASVATDPVPEDVPVRTKPLKTEKSLDILADFLATQGTSAVLVRAAVEAAYGGVCTPDRELSSLKLIKQDERFVIANGAGGAATVGLVEKAGAAPAAETAAENKAASATAGDAAPAKTLGEHVATAKAGPQRIPWNHGLGSSVMLLTQGQPPKRATIRNIHNHGAFALYDLTVVAGGTIDGVPANRIGEDPEAKGELAELRMENAALRRHADKGAELAQKHIQMAAVERQMAEVLKKHRESMEAVQSQLEEHARSEPGQTDLRDVVGEGAPAKPAPGPARGEKMKAPPKPSEDKLADPPPAAEAHADDAVDLVEVGLTTDQIEAARFEQGTASTGKPQQVKPVTIKGQAWVAVDAQRGCAVLLRVIGKKDWKAAEYGKPLELPGDKQPKKLAEGGRWCGVPVKVGRTTCWLDATRFALLVRLPLKQLAAAPEAKATGKDAASGA